MDEPEYKEIEIEHKNNPYITQIRYDVLLAIQQYLFAPFDDKARHQIANDIENIVKRVKGTCPYLIWSYSHTEFEGNESVKIMLKSSCCNGPMLYTRIYLTQNDQAKTTIEIPSIYMIPEEVKEKYAEKGIELKHKMATSDLSDMVWIKLYGHRKSHEISEDAAKICPDKHIPDSRPYSGVENHNIQYINEYGLFSQKIKWLEQIVSYAIKDCMPEMCDINKKEKVIKLINAVVQNAVAYGICDNEWTDSTPTEFQQKAERLVKQAAAIFNI